MEVEHWTARWTSATTDNPRLQLVLFKTPSVLADLLTLGLLLLLLRDRGLPLERWAIYAWCPTPVVEFWHEGHNDSWVVAAVVGALLLAGRRRWVGSFAALTVGMLVKFWPAALFPLFVFNPVAGVERPRWLQWCISLPLAAPFVWLYWAPVGENVDFMSGFLGGWRNNDSLFALVLWAAGPAAAKYAVAALLLVLVAMLVWRRVPLVEATLWFIAGMLLLSANVHPWYLTWIVPLLAVVTSVPLFLWVGLMPLAYMVLAEFSASGRWDGSTPRRWLIYSPVFAAALIRRKIT